MNWIRAIAVWMLIAVVESVHGTIRQLFLAPVIGDMPSRQVGVFVGSALILLVSWLTARWLGADTFKNQFRIGALWVVFIVIFEFSLGLALGYTVERILSDYNPANGGLMVFGLLFMLFAPALGAKLRNKNRRQ
ncbi:MAG: hypothetical protein MUC95_07275 [Spirochaetes bacterium]|nr:hypothetical protein [Spirochaetota bacterium]